MGIGNAGRMSPSSYHGASPRMSYSPSSSSSGSESESRRNRKFSVSNRMTPKRPRRTSCSDSDSVEKFAGARFTSPPSPEDLPTPPMEWFAPNADSNKALDTLSMNLKNILHIQA